MLLARYTRPVSAHVSIVLAIAGKLHLSSSYTHLPKQSLLPSRSRGFSRSLRAILGKNLQVQQWALHHCKSLVFPQSDILFWSSNTQVFRMHDSLPAIGLCGIQQNPYLRCFQSPSTPGMVLLHLAVY